MQCALRVPVELTANDPDTKLLVASTMIIRHPRRIAEADAGRIVHDAAIIVTDIGDGELHVQYGRDGRPDDGAAEEAGNDPTRPIWKGDRSRNRPAPRPARRRA